MRTFLEALGIPANQVPAEQDGRAALFRSLLADRRVLVVLDNSRNSGHARPLLPGGSGCLTVVTSRNELTGLVAVEGAVPLVLGLMTEGESRELLAARLGWERVDAHHDATQNLIRRCARLPLALSIVAATALVRHDTPLVELVADLNSHEHPLDALRTDDPTIDVRTVFSLSTRHLGVDAARIFFLLGLHPGAAISLAAAAALADVSTGRARDLLGELVRAGLMEQRDKSRFVSHDLLHAYATEQSGIHLDGTTRSAAVERLLDLYRGRARAAYRTVSHGLTPPGASTSEEDTTTWSEADAMAWYDEERTIITPLALNHGFLQHAWQIPACLSAYFDRRGHWYDWLKSHDVALIAANRVGDVGAEAAVRRGAAQARVRLGDLAAAQHHLEHALDGFARVNDHIGHAKTHLTMAVLAEGRDQPSESLAHAQKALDLMRIAEQPPAQGTALALNGVGWYFSLTGDHTAGLDICRQALALNQKLDYARGEAATWDSLGHIHHHLHNFEAAVDSYHHALHLYDKLGERHPSANSLIRLGEVYQVWRRLDEARQAWQQALDILDELGHPEANQLRARLSGPDLKVVQHEPDDVQPRRAPDPPSAEGTSV